MPSTISGAIAARGPLDGSVNMPTDLPDASVAIVVACFNAGAHLVHTLTSIREQTFTAWECIVVDDGSTDDTVTVAQEFLRADPRFRLIHQANAGPSAARNAGLATVSDPVRMLAFVDGDDLWEPDALERLVEALDADEQAVGVYGLADYIDVEGHPIRPGAHPAVQRDRRQLGRFDLSAVPDDAPSTFSTLVVSGTIWPAAVALHRRQAVERVGGFDADLRRAEDWELYLRMSRHGHFAPIEHRVAWYRRHESNATSAEHAQAMAADHARVRNKAWASPLNDRRQRREIQAVWRRLTLRWVAWCLLDARRALAQRAWTPQWRALRAAAYFARLFAVGHPTWPDARFARLSVRYVVDRSTGAGGPPP